MRSLCLLALLLHSQLGAEAALSPTASANEAALARYYDEAVNQGLSQSAQAFLDESFTSDAALPGMKKGRDGFIGSLAVLRKAFPDLNIEILGMISQGDTTVVRYQMNGTHKGKFFSLSPTKKKVSVSGVDIWKLKDSKAIEHHGNFDALGMLVQMKIMPELK